MEDDIVSRRVLLSLLSDDPLEAEGMLTEYESTGSGGFGLAPATDVGLALVPFLQTSISVAFAAVPLKEIIIGIGINVAAQQINDRLTKYWASTPAPKPAGHEALLTKVAEAVVRETAEGPPR